MEQTKKEAIKDFAVRILSVGIAIVVVGGVATLVIGKSNSKVKVMPEVKADQAPRFATSWKPNQPIEQNVVFPDDVIYTIKDKDTLIRICRAHNINPTQYLMLAAYNQDIIKDPNKIYIGDVIKIPVQEKLEETSIEALNNGNPLLSQNYHLVKEGDRLVHICEQKYHGKGYLAYGLAHWQHLNPYDLKVNQFIYLLSEEELVNYYAANYNEIQEYQAQYEGSSRKI